MTAANIIKQFARTEEECNVPFWKVLGTSSVTLRSCIGTPLRLCRAASRSSTEANITNAVGSGAFVRVSSGRLTSTTM